MQNQNKILEEIINSNQLTQEFLTKCNVILDSKINNDITKQFNDIKREYNNLDQSVKIGKEEIEKLDDDNNEHPGFDWSIGGKQTGIDGNKIDELYKELSKTKHPLVDKIEKLNSLLEDNKKQTDKLYNFVVEAKSKNNSQEFTSEESFKEFLKSNNSDLAKLGSTKELMQVSNAFIKIDPQPKDFNRFIDKIDNSIPGKKNVIIEFIEKILDKLFSVSQSEKIGKDMIRDLGTAIKQSSQNQNKDKPITR